MIWSRESKAKPRRQFRPKIDGNNGLAMLEPRILAAAVFQRNPAKFNGGLATSSSSETFNDQLGVGAGQGSGWDSVYVVNAQAFSAAQGLALDFNGNAIYTTRVDSKVVATMSGPGSGVIGDPQTATSNQIQLDVKHTGSETFTNNTPNPIDSRGLIYTGESSQSSSGPNGAGMVYTIGGGANGLQTVTATFQATISATGANGKFTVGASLDLDTKYLDVTLNGNGISATGTNTAPKSDANFQKTLPYNAFFTYTVTVPNVPDGTELGIRYGSSLSTSIGADGGMVIGGPPPGSPLLQPGATTNDASFNWSITYNVA